MSRRILGISKVDEHSANEDIIAYCANPSTDRVLSEEGYSNRVVRISDRAVVKFGFGVTRQEAEGQRIAYETVDQGIVRIPCVYRFFTDRQGFGYIVMEYAEGRIIDPLEEPTRLQRLADVLSHFASLQRDVPGSLGGGCSRGLLFQDTEQLVFDSVEVMETWFNSRLLPHQPKLSFDGLSLVLCHLDMAPRNILWGPDDAIWIIDWASAGYYPRLFEFCAQSIVLGMDGKFNQLVLNSMKSLTDHESAQMKKVLQAWKNFQQFYFAPGIKCWLSQSKKPIEKKIHIPASQLPPYPQDWLDRELARKP